MNIVNISHVAYAVSDIEEAFRFYVDALGMKRKFVLTNEAQLQSMKNFYKEQEIKMVDLPKEYQNKINYLKEHKRDIWLAYLEIAPNQYLELFPIGREYPHYMPSYQERGYLHLALEVDDIYEAYGHLLQKNIKILSQPSLGMDGAYQFWIEDFDGNRIEMMQYKESSLQIVGN